jgi:hypothetical protein
MAIGRRRVWLGKQAKPGDKARKVSTARADAHAAGLCPHHQRTTGERRDDVAGHRKTA